MYSKYSILILTIKSRRTNNNVEYICKLFLNKCIKYTCTENKKTLKSPKFIKYLQICFLNLTQNISFESIKLIEKNNNQNLG